MADAGWAETRFARLVEHAKDRMGELGVPGTAIGVALEGRLFTASLGVTQVEIGTPVTDDTMFQIGSTTKTFTTTELMRLVDAGLVDLAAPVRRYVPELVLADEAAAAAVTVRDLLTHVGGWAGDYFEDTGWGDDAVARYVTRMKDLPQLTPVGAVWSYNNAAFSLAGRIIEKVRERPYEAVMMEELVGPLGLHESFFSPVDVMTRRFAVGHVVKDGKPAVARPWAIPRSANPAGGIASSVTDQLRYARFHMGEDLGPQAEAVLSRASRARMQEEVVKGALDQGQGLAWMLSEAAGTRIVAHGGGTNGQISEFWFAPDAKLACTVLTNSSEGGRLGTELSRHVREAVHGAAEEVPTGEEWPAERLVAYAGRYVGHGTVRQGTAVTVDGADLVLTIEETKMPESVAELSSDPPPPIHFRPFAPDLVVSNADGPFKGMRMEFLRDPSGEVRWLRFGGRLHTRE